MRTAELLTPDKLRGGFYTPDPLVAHCLTRVAALNGHSAARVLEPTAGDGAFLRALLHGPVVVDKFVGIELIEEEARKCLAAASNASFDTEIIAADFLDWVGRADRTDHFDVAIGNPPFVRYQFIGDGTTRGIERLGKALGISFRGVSNLWIPIFLGALSRLRPGGVMAFVVPAELFTGLSAGVARNWLIQHFEALRVDLFAAGSFPEVLQEIIVVSGRRSDARHSSPDGGMTIEFVEHVGHEEVSWRHSVSASERNWTRYLLTERQLGTLEEAREVPAIVRLGDVAKLEVSIVTGANAYFSVSSDEVKEFGLKQWTIPLLPRIRNAPGLIYSKRDHALLANGPGKAWFLDFSEARKSPLDEPRAKTYLKRGELLKLHLRYKTSIRTPWFRVPSVATGRIMLSKRSHTFPRMVLNDAGAVTTDTIYRGDVLPIFSKQRRDVVAAFHNSLTLLDAELEGRSFGGGVLELVPSEIARLHLPFGISSGALLERLDAGYRNLSASDAHEDELIEITNTHIASSYHGLTSTLLSELEDARRELQARRFLRNRSS